MPSFSPSFFALAGRRLRLSASVAVALSLSACASLPGSGESAQAVLARASSTLGAGELQSIEFSGAGTGSTYGQAFAPGNAWPRIAYSSFSRSADYANAAFREDAARTRTEPNGGGAVPLLGQGEQRTSGWLRGRTAWNMVGPAPQAAPVARDMRIHDLWTTPHGIIKAALANQPQVALRLEGSRTLSAVSFSVPGQFRATLLVNAAGLVEQIESTVPHPVSGDTPSVITFYGYQKFGNVQFPMRILQSMGGTEVLNLTVTEVKPNAPLASDIPALVSAFAETVAPTLAAPGVWHLAGGSHNSVAIEMKDHMMVVESPLYDGRALAALAEAKKLGAGKAIRFVVNSHHHFDHSGGLRAAVAEGATLVTSEPAKAFFEAALSVPNSIAPDAMQSSGKKAVITGVAGKRSFSDGVRMVDVYAIDASIHAQGFLMVHLPLEKLLIQADAFTPGVPNAPAPAKPNDNHVNLVQNIERLKLDVERILPLHGRMVPIAELYAAIGKKP